MTYINNELQYLGLLRQILEQGERRADRTGTGTIGIFGAQLRFNLRQSFPLLTTKRVFTKGVVHELLWFLKGQTNIQYLLDNDVHIWDDWADKDGNLGPVYGSQWRSWPKVTWSSDGYSANEEPIDQITKVIREIKANPYSRRLIVSAWNPAEIDDMALPPCHLLFQFNVRGDEDGYPEYLDCQLYQRSADMFLGVPFNIASYALLTHMVARVTDLKPGHFVHTFGDAHIYLNHLDQVQEQLGRTVLPPPQLWLRHKDSINDFDYDDVEFINYRPHPAIKGEVSV